MWLKYEKRMSILQNYKSTLLLLLGIIVGGICGALFGEHTAIVKPLGDIFLNFMYVLVVPIVFLSVSQSMYSMKKMNTVGAFFVKIIGVFLIMSVMAALLSILVLKVYNPMERMEIMGLSAVQSINNTGSMSAGDMFVNTLTVPEFLQLFEKPHLLQLIVFAIVFGLAAAASGEKGQFIGELLDASSVVVMKMMDFLMKLAPICLGCYFAYTLGSMGSQIVGIYWGAFVVFLVLTILVFGILNTIYMYVAGGMPMVKTFWCNMLKPSLTAIATSSSAACIPVNIEAALNMGVQDGIARTVIPFGTNMHKDGSVVSAVVKIVFLMVIVSATSPMEISAFTILWVSVVSSIVVGAIPSGGMTGELLICSILGFSPELAGSLLVVATIVDIPATLLNSGENVVAAVLVDKLNKAK